MMLIRFSLCLNLYFIFIMFSCLLCFNELYHVYLLIRACFSVHHMPLAEIMRYDYCGDYSLQIGDKLGFK